MSLAFGFALPHWKILSGGFSPSVLFAAGEQGAWYDPSDSTTLFQDATGTTPTTMETRARLMLDKSKGLVQTTVYTNDGNTASGWVYSGGAGGSIAASGGKLVFTCATTLTALQDRLARYEITGLTTGQNYLVTASLQNISDGVGARLGIASSALAGDTTGTYVDTNSASLTPVQFIFTASSSTMYLRLIARVGNSNAQIGVDDIRVATLPGNHATAPSDASSPILRARYNLLTWSEDFSNAAWDTNGGSVTKTASTITATATTSQHFAAQNVSGVVSGYVYRTHIELKYGNNQFVVLRGLRGNHICIDILNGLITAKEANISNEAITSISDGWYRITFDWTATSSGGGSTLVILSNANSASNPTWTATGTEFVNVRNVDVRPSSDAALNIPTYQSITTATSYDTAGFPPYLAFDGTDDSFSTASIDFTGTDKMTVFAGVTKLSDAALTILTELSANFNSNNGSFYIAAPELTGASGNFSANLRGSTAPASAITSGTDTAPVTRVVTVTSDIDQALRTMRISGVQTAQSSQSQGTGNFGNYPLFIGRRNNTSLPFNGRIYSLIIRGAATTTPLIASTEQWVAGKMRLPI